MVLQMLGYHVTSLVTKCNIICHVALMEFYRLDRMPIRLDPAMWSYPTVQTGTRQQKHQFVIDLSLESIQSISLLVEKTTVSDSARRAIILKPQRKSRKRSYQFIIHYKLYEVYYILNYMKYIIYTVYMKYNLYISIICRSLKVVLLGLMTVLFCRPANSTLFGPSTFMMKVSSIWNVQLSLLGPSTLDFTNQFDERYKV